MKKKTTPKTESGEKRKFLRNLDRRRMRADGYTQIHKKYNGVSYFANRWREFVR